MNSPRVRRTAWFASSCLALIVTGIAAQQPAVTSSYGPTNQTETFDQIKAARLSVKAARARAHADLLSSRYVLDARTDPVVKMSGGKPIPVGPTAKIAGVTWEQLGQMTPEQIRDQGLFPYKPLPFADHAEGGMLFPDMTLKLLPRLTRFDLDFDLPEHILPEAAPALYLTTRPDLGDVAKGRLVTLNNYYEIFNGILNPKQLEGLRLLVTQFPQQQFNATEDRRTDRPEGMLGVTCFDCHANGHTNGAGRTSMVTTWWLPRRASSFLPSSTSMANSTLPRRLPANAGGEAIFNGKGQCARCHQAPYYTDNSMHDLRAERFYKQELANGMMMAHDGAIKTFPLRGIKDSPPYLHDGRCFTLEDTVEYFSLVLQLRLNAEEKKDVVAFLRTL